MRHYCTYFDRRYLPRGLALFHSLRTQAHVFCLHVLCLDDTCYDILVRANFEQLKPIRLPDLEAYDAELASARGRRTLVEYYFTLTAVLPLFLFDSDPDITLITYLDSDLFFFGNPEVIFEEMGSASILIVGHRFPPAGKFREINGIYNVSFISWRSDKEGRACLEWFRERTLEWCCDVVEEARFADQKYLDDWPVRFSGVHVLRHKGCNVAPFNFESYRLSWHDDRFFIDGAPLIFYHFHGLSNWYELSFDQTGISEYLISPSSDLALLLAKVYEPYIEALCRARDEAERAEIEPQGAAIREIRGPVAPLAAAALPWREYLAWSPISPADKPVWEMPYFFPEDRGRAWRAYMSGRRGSPHLSPMNGSHARFLAIETILADATAAVTRQGLLRILDWGGARDHIPGYRIAVDRLGRKLESYIVVGAASSNKSDLMESYPGVVFVETLEEGIATDPDVALVTGALIAARSWFGNLARLAGGARILVLDDIRTLSGTDTLVAMRRPAGSATAEPVWILNIKELRSAFHRLGLVVEREYVWFDPVRLSYIPELADCRTFVLRCPKKPEKPKKPLWQRLHLWMRSVRFRGRPLSCV
jgi:hypothetical protein